MDIVLICWRTPQDLRRLAKQVAMQIVAVGRDWEVLVCGKKLQQSSSRPIGAYWMQSPRCYDFCGARITETGDYFISLTSTDVSNMANAVLSRTSTIDHAARALAAARETRPSRHAYYSEVCTEMQEEVTPAKYFTGYGRREVNVPFIRLNSRTGQYGSSREREMACATLMFSIMHLTVAVAIGLMAVATGRGLAVWLMAVRPTMDNLGAADIYSCEAFLALWAWDHVVLKVETERGSEHVAGDVVGMGLDLGKLVGSTIVPLLEIIIIVAGWIYGALRVQRLRPSGIVGHGMLVLSAAVALALSIRAAFGVKKRTEGRLVGIFQERNHVRYIVGRRYVSVSTEQLRQDHHISAELYLVSRILFEVDDDDNAIGAAMGILRCPAISTILPEYITRHVLQYSYSGDTVMNSRGRTSSSLGPPKPLRVRVIYPYIQASCCIFITAACTCASVLYAYFDFFPFWVKLLVEGLLAVSATWWSVLERSAGLPHERDAYVCFMVSNMVAASVWFVGVKDVG